MSNVKSSATLRDEKTLDELHEDYKEASTQEEKDAIFNQIKAYRYDLDDDIERIHKETLIRNLEDERIQEKFHPLANILPLMKKGDLDLLARDIKKNGLLNPIVLLEEKILDGRNRYLACLKARIKPTFREFTEGIDPYDFVVSENLHRRNLKKFSSAIRCETGLQMLEKEEERARERQRRELKQFKNEDADQTDPSSVRNGSRDQKGEAMKIVASRVQVSPHTLRMARKIKKVAETNPEIKQKWEQAIKGKIAISKIYKEITNETPNQESKKTQEIKLPKKSSKNPDTETIRNVIDYLTSLEIDPYLPILARNLRTRFNFVIKRNETLSGMSLESSKRQSTKN